jgi:hypothetical protein
VREVLNVARKREVISYIQVYIQTSQYNRDIVESGVKHHNINHSPISRRNIDSKYMYCLWRNNDNKLTIILLNFI